MKKMEIGVPGHLTMLVLWLVVEDFRQGNWLVELIFINLNYDKRILSGFREWERQSKIERDRERLRETERDWERQREIERDRERLRETERDWERQRERLREAEHTALE